MHGTGPNSHARNNWFVTAEQFSSTKQLGCIRLPSPLRNSQAPNSRVPPTASEFSNMKQPGVSRFARLRHHDKQRGVCSQLQNFSSTTGASAVPDFTWHGFATIPTSDENMPLNIPLANPNIPRRYKKNNQPLKTRALAQITTWTQPCPASDVANCTHGPCVQNAPGHLRWISARLLKNFRAHTRC